MLQQWSLSRCWCWVMTGSDIVSQALFGNIGYTRSDYRIMMTECGNVGNDQYGVGTAVGCLSANGFEVGHVDPTYIMNNYWDHDIICDGW